MPTLTIPNTFVDDEVIDAAEHNANNNAIATLLNSTKLDADNLQDAAVTAAKLASNAVETAKIVDAAVTTAKINDAAVTAAKIGSGAVTGAKLDSSVADASTLELSGTSLRIKDAGITQAKLAARALHASTVAAGGIGISADIGDQTFNSGTLTAATNLSIDITTTGRPVFVGLVPASDSDFCYVSADSSGTFNLYFFRGGTGIGRHTINSPSGEVFHPPGAFYCVDTPAAGTYTYSVAGLNATANGSISHCKLLVYEL
jgi:hypothetical protein